MLSILLFYAIIIWQVWLLSRNKTVGLREVAQAFLWGAVGIFFPVYIIHNVGILFMSADAETATWGPFFEEALKVLLVVWVLYWSRAGKSFSISDGILLGVAAGSGFAFMEDTLRVFGSGLDSVLLHSANYAFSALPGVLVSWLPYGTGEPMVTSGLIYMTLVGHAWWTALAAGATAFAFVLGRGRKWTLLVAAAALLFVTMDHGIFNYIATHGFFGIPGDPPPGFGGVFAAYGRGAGIRWLLTVGIVLQLVLDEWLIRKHLPKSGVLLPGEASRSFWGEILQSLRQLGKGWRPWLAMLAYFRLRRQLAFAAAGGLDDAAIRKQMSEQKSALTGKGNWGDALRALLPRWQWAGRSIWQRAQAIAAAVVVVYGAWLLLLAGYMPSAALRWVMSGVLPWIAGIVGAVLVVMYLWRFYAQRQWRALVAQPNDRVSFLAAPVLLHSSALLFVLALLGLFGAGPFKKSTLLSNNKYTTEGAGEQFGVGATATAAAQSGFFAYLMQLLRGMLGLGALPQGGGHKPPGGGTKHGAKPPAPEAGRADAGAARQTEQPAAPVDRGRHDKDMSNSTLIEPGGRKVVIQPVIHQKAGDFLFAEVNGDAHLLLPDGTKLVPKAGKIQSVPIGSVFVAPPGSHLKIGYYLDSDSVIPRRAHGAMFVNPGSEVRFVPFRQGPKGGIGSMLEVQGGNARFKGHGIDRKLRPASPTGVMLGTKG